MKIVSKYKDYYDGVQAMGFDEKLVFVRHQELKSFKKPNSYNKFREGSDDTLELDRINLETSNYEPEQEHIDCYELIIGFCGKLYPGIIFKHVKNEQVVSKKVYYDSKGVLSYIDKLKSQYRKLYFRCSFYNYYLPEPIKELLDQHFNQNCFKANYEDWFQDFNTPIFRIVQKPNMNDLTKHQYGKDEIIHIELNPKLKDLEFYRLKDNYSAYQELSQFLGGVLSKRDKINDNLTDIEKVHQHGFDKKYGFRTRPPK